MPKLERTPDQIRWRYRNSTGFPYVIIGLLACAAALSLSGCFGPDEGYVGADPNLMEGDYREAPMTEEDFENELIKEIGEEVAETLPIPGAGTKVVTVPRRPILDADGNQAYDPTTGLPLYTTERVGIVSAILLTAFGMWRGRRKGVQVEGRVDHERGKRKNLEDQITKLERALGERNAFDAGQREGTIIPAVLPPVAFPPESGLAKEPSGDKFPPESGLAKEPSGDKFPPDKVDPAPERLG